MVYLKACPRCRGDLFTETYLRDRDITCLQCGHVLSACEELTLQVQASTWVPSPPRQPFAA